MDTERIALVTDSTGDLSDTLVKTNDIHRVSLKVSFGSEDFWDRENITPDQFYEKLQNNKNFPRTTPPTSKKFMEVFQNLIDDDYTHILCLFISGKLSKTSENAQFSANMISRAKIAIIDSKTTSYGLGFLTLYARGLIRQNLPFDEIVKKVEEQVPKTLLIFSVDNLSTLERGGRIGKAKAFFGNLLGVRPILSLKDGTGVIEPLTTVKSGDAANQAMVDMLMEFYNKHGAAQGLCVMYTSAQQNSHAARKMLIENGINPSHLVENRIGAVVGAHLGPTGWGVGVC